MRAAALVLLAASVLACTTEQAQAREREVDLASVERHLERTERRLVRIEAVAARYERWRRCVRELPVTEYGDTDGGRAGFLYEERDGTGAAGRAALALAPSRTSADYWFVRFSRRGTCRSRRTEPGGTAESASVAANPSNEDLSPQARVAALAARLLTFARRIRAIERSAKRFDAWESCLTQIPVTQYGDPGGLFGFLAGPLSTTSFRPAMAIDRSDWDDPDYRILGFKRGDQPGADCDNDPGESSD